MRNIGLDVARSVAILMVLISHSRIYFVQYVDLQWISFNGFLGVELFFVLSGFLIGRIIINSIVEKPSIANLLTFYKRRWYRTLPLYFLMVFILFLLGKQFHWTNLFFLQNFNEVGISFFPVSWSLSVEEWFYLTVPFILLVIFAFIKVKNKGLLFIIITTLLLLLFNAIRAYEVIVNNPTWDYGVRKQIYLRLDSILTGVLVAGINVYFKKFYDSIKASYLYLISISGLFACVYYYVFELDAGKEIINSSFFGRSLLFSFVSLFFGLLIAALEKTDFSNYKFTKLVTFLSVTSYAVYLVHHELFMYASRFNDRSVLWSWFLLALTLILSYIISFVLHKYFEKPIMDLRDKKLLKNKSSKNLEHSV